MFANKAGYNTSLMSPVFKSLSTSFLIALYLSGLKVLIFYLIGLKLWSIFSLYTIISGAISSMSLWDHEKTSKSYIRNSTRAYLAPIRVLLLVLLVGLSFVGSSIHLSGSFFMYNPLWYIRALSWLGLSHLLQQSCLNVMVC